MFLDDRSETIIERTNPTIPINKATRTGWLASAIPPPTANRPDDSALLTPRMSEINLDELRAALAATMENETDNNIGKDARLSIILELAASC